MITDASEEVMQYLRLFCFGKEKARRAVDIAHEIGINDDRAVRETVHDLRCRGEAVASSSHGFFIPATLKEAEESLAELRQRIKAQSVSAAGYHRGLRAMFPEISQLRLGLEFGAEIDHATLGEQ